ncbi:MAG: restriction endonuclease subunit S [Phocaeicola sp.]
MQEDGLIVSTGFAVLHPLIGNSSFLSYFALSESFIHNVIVNSKGISYPAITASDLICIAMPLPPLSEQEAIVTYLDTKVAKIDEYISIAEKKIAALEELRQTIIAEAVTRGIHKDVPMKDSGVKWIGMIPEHWKIRKMKFVFKERSEKGYPNEPVLSATQSNGVIPQSMYENRVVVVNKGFENLKLVCKGDFVISLRSFQGGIEYAYYRGIISAAYTILTKSAEFLNEGYVKNLFKSHPFVQLLKTCVTGIREGQNINYSLLRDKYIPVPPLAEQQEIVTYIEAKVANINQLCQAERSQIEKLKEYKQRLISDVVTGKVKVTND